MSMAAYFDRDDVALPGFAKRFRANCDEEREHAQMTDFLEGEYLKEQVEAQKEIGDLITKMKRAGEALVFTLSTRNCNKHQKILLDILLCTIFVRLKTYTHFFGVCTFTCTEILKQG